jgi:hypothetical protein
VEWGEWDDFDGNLFYHMHCANFQGIEFDHRNKT